MSSKTMRNYTVLFCCALVAMLLNSCQKELTGTINTFGCKVQQWSSLTANGGIAYRFSYTYDSATAKASQLSYIDSSGFQVTVIPTYKGDTVFFSNSSYAVLDGSKRIKHLVEKSAYLQNGDYYYEYDAGGHLIKDTYDNGTNSQVYNATYTGDALTKFTMPSGTVTDASAFNYTYSDSIKVLGYNYFMMVENNFSELELYLPCFSVGTFTTKAVIRQDFTVLVPVVTIPNYSVTFTNYSLTGQGYISSLSANLIYNGVTPLGGISASYLCK